MRPKQNSGFTLIEVLIAFTILALVLGVVLPTLASGLSHERTARLATARVLEARSILDGLGIEIPLEEGSWLGRSWRVSAGELDQRGRARGVVAKGPADPCVVTMGDYDDRLLGASGDHGDDIAQLDLPEVR